MANLLASFTSGDNRTHSIPDGTVTKRSQSWKPNATATLGSIELKLWRTGSPGTLTVQVYSVDGNDLPTGSVLSSGTYNANSLSAVSPGTWISVSMSSYSLTSGTSYALVLSLSAGDASNTITTPSYVGFGGYGNGLHGEYDGSWAQVSSGLSDFFFKVYDTAAGAPSKASNPTPANGATEVDFSGYVLDWDGNGDTYNVYGGASGNWILVAEGIADTTTTLSSTEVLSFVGGVVTWRVDSINDSGTTIGDDWTFDPRPGKASSPTPSDAGSDIALTQAFSWTLGTNGTTNSLIIGSTTYLSASANVSWTPDTDAFTWNEDVTWRVDTTNEFGTTTGDSWTFTALDLDHLRLTYQSIDGGDGPYDGGTEGVDFRWTGLNNVVTIKRLVVFAKDRLFYETL